MQAPTPTTTIPFSAAQLKDFINHSVYTVFQKMTFLQADIIQALKIDAKKENLTSIIQNISDFQITSITFKGKANGAIHLIIPKKLAFLIACQLMRLPAKDDSLEDDIITDCLREMANMISGDFKNKLCELGYECVVSLPTSLPQGEFPAHYASDTGAPTTLYEFKVNSISYYVDLAI